MGYDWSNRKGSEGIVLNPNGGYLTNEQNRFAHGTLATFVRNAFRNMRTEMGEETTLQKYVASYRTIDMLDFSRADFDKALKTTADKKIIVISKYPLVKLGSFAEIAKGKSITKSEAKEGNIKVVAGGVDYAYLHNVANREANTITISASGANAGFVNFWKEPIFASDCTTVRGRNEIETLFLYNFLQSIQDQIYYLQKGSAQPHVYPDDIADLQIPQIEEEKMQQIVAECQKVDEEYNSSRMSIEDYRKKIAQVFENLQVIGGGKRLKLDQLCVDIFAGGDKPQEFSTTKTEEMYIPVYANGVENDGLVGYTNHYRVNQEAITISARGTLGFTCVRKEPFFPIVRLIVAIPNQSIIKVKYFKYAVSTITFVNTGGSIPQLTVPNVEKEEIFVPSLADQERIIAQVEQYEAAIRQAQAIMDGCAARKKAILDKYLK